MHRVGLLSGNGAVSPRVLTPKIGAFARRAAGATISCGLRNGL
jgi:hypothetical protein